MRGWGLGTRLPCERLGSGHGTRNVRRVHDFLWLYKLCILNTIFPLHTTDALNVRILSDELSTVSDWYQLGIKLGVPDYKLDEIQRSYPTEGCSRWKVEACPCGYVAHQIHLGEML